MPLQLVDLLSNGYFPKELPPPFSTTSFANSVAGSGVEFPADLFSTRPKYSMLCTHNLIRTGGLRRNLGIPNPKHFYLLANHVVTYWKKLTACTSISPFSLSKPVDGNLDRAITPEHSLDERTNFRAKLRSNARFILNADISRFFPSLYTHSIPWAIMGKSDAKTAHKSRKLEGRWEGQIDTLSRAINNNQTIGIPIGPDTSRLIAEVILSRIDIELKSEFPELNGLRYIDDYEFAFGDRSLAESVLSFLQYLLNKFELALNPNKTMILELPEQFDFPWLSKIRIFYFREGGSTAQKNDLSAYFDMVFDFFKRFPNEHLMKYAIARLRSEEIRKENWDFFENVLRQCLRIEPSCLPQVCDQIVYYHRTRGFPVARESWEDCLNTIVYERVPLGQSSEAAWSMWLMKLLDIGLREKAAKTVGECDDSIVGLMGLGLAATGLADRSCLDGLNQFCPHSELYEDKWLLCYQGNILSWLGPSCGSEQIKEDPTFAYLESQNVSFFNIDVAPSEPIRHTRAAYSGKDGGY